jgi:hypothetical protein
MCNEGMVREQWWDFIQNQSFFFSLSRARFGGFSLTQPYLFFFLNLLFSLSKDSERDEKRKNRNTKKRKFGFV